MNNLKPKYDIESMQYIYDTIHKLLSSSRLITTIERNNMVRFTGMLSYRNMISNMY